jgi:hypothetical protein
MRFSVAHHVQGEEGGEEASRTEVEGTLRQERDVRV